MIHEADDMKPKNTSGSVRSHPLVSILLSDVVAIVRGKMLLIYCNKIGMPSTGQITPEKKKKNKFDHTCIIHVGRLYVSIFLNSL